MPTRAEITSWPDATLLTRKETASLLACRHLLLEEWAALGRGPPYIKSGRYVRYELGVVRKWIASHRRRTVIRR